MSNYSRDLAIEIEAETNFAEATSTYATLRLPLLDPVDTSGFKKPKIAASGLISQTLQGGTKLVDGPFDVKFKTKHYWTGHGSSTLGATSASPFETYLGNIFGSAPVVSLASGTTFTGGTAAVPTTTVANGAVAGAILFGGVLGDGRAGGQALVVNTHAANALTPLTVLPAAPNAADVCRSAVMIAPPEAPTNGAMTSYRMRFLSGNLRYEVKGCVPTAVSFSPFTAGERPTIEVSWEGASFVETTGGTFPSTLATFSALPSVITGGSVVMAAVGSTLRTLFSVRSFAVDYQMNTELERGPGGLVAGQTLVNARRKGAAIKVSFMIDADTVTANPVLKAIFAAANPVHLTFTGSTADGSSFAFYCPNVEPCGEYPAQVSDNDLNRMRFEGMCYSGATPTSELTLSAIRFAMG